MSRQDHHERAGAPSPSSAEREGAGHAHEEDDGHAAFPRRATAEAIASELGKSERRGRLQVGLVALGFALVALALPTEALFGQSVATVAATAHARGTAGALVSTTTRTPEHDAASIPATARVGEPDRVDVSAPAANARVEGPHVVPELLARALVAFGIAPEPAWFVLAAFAFAFACLPLVRIARDRGWEHGPAFAAASLALAAPVVLVASTTPDASAFRLLGASLACAALVRGIARERTDVAHAHAHANAHENAHEHAHAHEHASAARDASRSVRAAFGRALAWLAASLLHAGNAWTWPAFLAFELLVAERSTRARRLAFVCAAPVVFALVFVALHANVGSAAHVLERALLAGGSGGPGPLLAWTTLWPLALGGAGVGLAAWLVGVARGGWKREPELVLFALVPWTAEALGGALDWELPWLELVPLGVLGLLALAQRAEERPHAPKLGLAALALALYGVLGAAWIRSLDRNAAWTADASERLNPGDVVMTASPEHRHLLEHRFHVATVDLRPIGARPADERARFWNEQRAAAVRLATEGRRLVLDADSLADFGTLAWPDAAELERFVADARPVLLPDDRWVPGTAAR